MSLNDFPPLIVAASDLLKWIRDRQIVDPVTAIRALPIEYRHEFRDRLMTVFLEIKKVHDAREAPDRGELSEQERSNLVTLYRPTYEGAYALAESCGCAEDPDAWRFSLDELLFFGRQPDQILLDPIWTQRVERALELIVKVGNKGEKEVLDELPASGNGKSSKRPRGRTPIYDPVKDEKLYEDWKASDYKTIKDFAKKRGMKASEVQQTIDRVESRRRSEARQAP